MQFSRHDRIHACTIDAGIDITLLRQCKSKIHGILLHLENSDCAPTFDAIQLNTASIGHAFVIYTGRKYCMGFVLHDVISVCVATRLCCVHMHCPNF